MYEKVTNEFWMQVITTKWFDIKKANSNYRDRLVGREIAWETRDDLFAATAPLESLKVIDVKRAYFYSPATRTRFAP